MARIDSQNDVFCQINDFCFRVEGGSVKDATNMIFQICDKYILSDLKELRCGFGLEWNFISSNNGRRKIL